MQINLPRWAIDELDTLTDKSVKAYVRELILAHIRDHKTLNGPQDGNSLKESVIDATKEETDQINLYRPSL